MNKIIATVFAAILLLMPLAAEAQQQKKQQNGQNPLTFIIGIFSAVNCIITCGGITSTVATTIVIPQNEGPPLIATSSSNSNHYGAFVGGAAVCTVLWPFINHLTGGPEPTPEQALANSISCWVPGLGVLLYLQSQNAP